MRFLIAPDKLKGSISAADAADEIAAGIRSVLPEATLDLCPIADGGEGTVAALLAALGGRLNTRRVTGPLPEMKVDASFAMLADGITAVIEMSAASGLALLKPEDRNPLHTTTFGTGELINAAIAEGAKTILLGLGGSATIDAGIGLAQACGFTVLMKDGEPTSLSEPLCGRDLSNVLMVKQGRGEKTSGIEFIGLTDVTNPLLGPTGAAKTFGPQKGASPETIQQLEDALLNLVTRSGQLDLANQPGSGAAGGLGFATLAFLRGSLVNGFNYIAKAADLESRIKLADLCVTAEGQIDQQTLAGKTVAGIALLCKKNQVPCVAIAGAIEAGFKPETIPGLADCLSLKHESISLAQSMSHVRPLLKQQGAAVAKCSEPHFKE